MGAFSSFNTWGGYQPFPPATDIWRKEFVWFPCRCKETNKLLWLTTAYHCVRKYREDVQIYLRPTSHWHSKEAHTFYLLKGNK